MEKYSVLMPLWYKENTEYLKTSLLSILGQTVKPDEVVMIEDHPISGEMKKLIEDLFADSGVDLNIYENFELDKKGLSSILNYGVAKCRNSLIARMDTDDIAYEGRCEAELKAFEADGELALVGGFADEFDEDPDVIAAVHTVPTKTEDIKKRMKYTNPFNHPTVMFKKDVILACGNYDCNLKKNEDYELWYRVVKGGYKCKNIGESLIKFRRGASFNKRRKNREQHNGKIELKRRMLKDGYMSKGEYILSYTIEKVYFLMPVGVRKIAFKILGK
ncbi:MAG: glycosyltransferase [Clostridia bacterium]|nr:glycosyltransferase [Clostridia bacterium]